MWNHPRSSAVRRRASSRQFILALLPLLATLAAQRPEAQAAALASATTLTVSSPSITSPAPITLNASVTAAGVAISAGTVTFCDVSMTSAPDTFCEDAAILGRAQLVAGTASIKFIPAIGAHTYKAMFHATAAASASTSPTQTLTVNGLYPTATAISASGNPDGYTLTATVTASANHPPVLAGTVAFQDTTNSDFVVGTAPLGTPSYNETFSNASGSPIMAVGNQPAATGVADFNKDGKPDVAVYNSYDNSIVILLGNGDGTFVAGQPIAGVGTTDCIDQDQASNCSMAVGDVNNDGNADLVVTSGADNTLIVLLGHGDGTFVFDGTPITVGTFPEAVKIADVNNDGFMDLIVANAKDNTVGILLGDGTGTFNPAPGSPVAVGNFPFFLAVADFNGDGNPDVAATNEDDSTLSILLGAGDGTFTQAPGSPIAGLNYNPASVVSADFNGDGFADLAVANFTPVGASPTGTVVILLGNNDGTFTQPPSSPLSVGVDPYALAVADFNQDGHTDLAVDNYGQIDNPATQTLSILLGDGKGGFSALGTPFQLEDSPNDLGIGDFNSDGTPDFAIPNVADFSLSILLNQFTQTATASVSGITIAGTGTHYVDAMYPGNVSFAPSTSSTVPLQGQTVATTLTLTVSPIEQMITMPVTFTAQLAATSAEAPSANPTGTVTYYDQSLGGITLGTAPMGANGQAVFTTTAIGPGTHVITASYAGDADFLASSSGNASVQIDELMIARVGNNNTNIVPGTTVVYTLLVTPQVATKFLYNVSFSTSGLPAGATATFSPVILAAGGATAKITMTVTTAKASAENAPPAPFGRLPLALGLLLPLFGAKTFRRRLQRLPRGLGLMLLVALGMAAAAGIGGCSGAGLFAAKKVPYAITVTATEGTLQRTTQVPLAIY